jgi:hypothetical protein
MTAALLVLALMTGAQDTIPPAPNHVLDGPPGPVSLAPTVDNLSLLGAALAAPTAEPEAHGFGVQAGSLQDPSDTTRPRRPKAIQYSDLYYTRLKIHQVASYLTVPLFVAQYFSGRELWNHPDSHGLARDAHGPLAASIAGLFAVNTVTGVWNLWDSRKDPSGRTRRWIHSLTMIAADAGFVVVGATAPGDDDREGGGGGVGIHSSGARTHRNVAIASMSVALSSYLMMLIWKD